MKTRKSFFEGVQFAWDATSLSTYETCPRLYQLSILEGWEPVNRSVHLEFGGLYASAIEGYWKLVATGWEHRDALREVVAITLQNTWDREKNEPITWDHDKKTRETLIRTIIWYFEEFGNDDSMPPIVLDNGKPAVELSFTLDLDEFLWCGHLDRLALYQGDAYVVDNKTTGSTITPQFFRGFKPDIQMAGYTLAGKIAYDTPVAGVVIDAAQIAVGFTRFARGFVTYTEPELNEWIEDAARTIALAKTMTHDYLEGKPMPMNRTSCHKYGGCTFRNICSRSPEYRKQFLLGDFKTREKLWDPLESR